MIRPAAYVLKRLLIGRDLNGELDGLSGPARRMADHLAGLPLEHRKAAFSAMVAARDDGPELVRAVDAVEPDSPPPEPEPTDRAATLADLRRLVADTSWPWPGWLAGGVLNALAADPGTGKTVLGMDLARRLWHADPWPDGQPATFPAGSRTLWVPGDRHYSQLLDLAGDYGIPDEALCFNAPPGDPVAGLDLDDPATLGTLDILIRSEAPALVIVDTVGMTTARNLCRPEDARAYFEPLMAMAGRTGVPFLLLTHLSKDGEALGRRIVGACRAAWKITTPDPDGQPDRRRLWVAKTYIAKPLPLGMTIASAGCSFDFNPPTKPDPEPRRPGPSAAKLDACKAWLLDRLTPNPARVSDVRTDAEKAGYAAGTLYSARDALGVDESTLDGRKWWRLPPPEAPEADDPEKPY